MKFKPLHNQVLITQDKTKEKTDQGLIIPETSRNSSTSGTVVATGDGLNTGNDKTIPMTVKVGDKVMLHNKYKGFEITLENEQYLLIEEPDILGIIT